MVIVRRGLPSFSVAEHTQSDLVCGGSARAGRARSKVHLAPGPGALARGEIESESVKKEKGKNPFFHARTDGNRERRENLFSVSLPTTVEVVIKSPPHKSTQGLRKPVSGLVAIITLIFC